MTGVTKCLGDGCPSKLKEKCFRYTCEHDHCWQSYAQFEKTLCESMTGDIACDNFISNKQEKKYRE